MNSGRKQAQSAIMVITDGKPSFKFETPQQVMKVRSNGVKVIMVPVNGFPNKLDRKFTKKLASAPWQSNLVPIPGVKKLKRQMDKYVVQTLVQSCPKAESPTAIAAKNQEMGFKLVR